ncbi:hypothetical protein OG874_35690 [Nocardia sp. NBC_00565]|nr:hypothetical protein [Nocardia sp. NBC_00565]WUC02034.1 hypothetical protein OG874_35690 [Nocardia sp. NBC_00565]
MRKDVGADLIRLSEHYVCASAVQNSRAGESPSSTNGQYSGRAACGNIGGGVADEERALRSYSKVGARCEDSVRCRFGRGVFMRDHDVDQFGHRGRQEEGETASRLRGDDSESGTSFRKCSHPRYDCVEDSNLSNRSGQRFVELIAIHLACIRNTKRYKGIHGRKRHAVVKRCRIHDGTQPPRGECSERVLGRRT